MERSMHYLLVFAITSIMVRYEPGYTLMNLCRHIHVSKRVNERRPWNFLKKLRWKVRNKSSKILESLHWTEVVRRRQGPCVDAIYGPTSLTCTNNRFNISKSFGTSYSLNKLQLTQGLPQLTVLSLVCVVYGG